MLWCNCGSIDLLEPLIGAGSANQAWLFSASAKQAWLSWKAHVEYFNLMMSEEFTRADIARLDKLIARHQALYDKVPHYHRVPKHHLCKHVPRDILRAGCVHIRPTTNAPLLEPLLCS